MTRGAWTRNRRVCGQQRAPGRAQRPRGQPYGAHRKQARRRRQRRILWGQVRKGTQVGIPWPGVGGAAATGRRKAGAKGLRGWQAAGVQSRLVWTGPGSAPKPWWCWLLVFNCDCDSVPCCAVLCRAVPCCAGPPRGPPGQLSRAQLTDPSNQSATDARGHERACRPSRPGDPRQEAKTRARATERCDACTAAVNRARPVFISSSCPPAPASNDLLRTSGQAPRPPTLSTAAQRERGQPPARPSPDAPSTPLSPLPACTHLERVNCRTREKAKSRPAAQGEGRHHQTRGRRRERDLTHGGAAPRESQEASRRNGSAASATSRALLLLLHAAGRPRKRGVHGSHHAATSRSLTLDPHSLTHTRAAQKVWSARLVSVCVGGAGRGSLRHKRQAGTAEGTEAREIISAAARQAAAASRGCAEIARRGEMSNNATRRVRARTRAFGRARARAVCVCVCVCVWGGGGECESARHPTRSTARAASERRAGGTSAPRARRGVARLPHARDAAAAKAGVAQQRTARPPQRACHQRRGGSVAAASARHARHATPAAGHQRPPAPD